VLVSTERRERRTNLESNYLIEQVLLLLLLLLLAGRRAAKNVLGEAH